LRPTTPATAPKAFLSYTFDDADLARKIANALQANGIETFLAEWSIHPGDSLRQKVDEGISDCTHFLVLLTPKSIVKPWVNQEMDAGFVRKLEEKARFIAIRAGLDVSALPVTLRSMHSPSIDNFEADIRQLVNDIHGITRRPPLGPAPTPATPVSTGHSEAANKIAKLMVEASEHAVHADPFFSVDEIAAKTGLSNDDVTDGAHELRQFLGKRFEGFFAKPELFAEFDRFFLGTNPRDDALRLAADMINDSNFPTQTPEIAKRYGWTARRINPAISYLLSRNLIRDSSELNSHPWITVWVDKTDETRRFVKSKT